MSYSYLQPSLMPSPKIPKPWGYSNELNTMENVDILGQPFTPSSTQPPFVPGITRCMGEIAEMQYRMIMFNITSNLAPTHPQEVHIRKGFYQELLQWRGQLPANYLVEENFTPETCFLR
jgi:hypothetical protein